MASLPQFNAILVQQGFAPYPLCLICEDIVHSDDDETVASKEVPEFGLVCGLECLREALARLSDNGDESKGKGKFKGGERKHEGNKSKDTFKGYCRKKKGSSKGAAACPKRQHWLSKGNGCESKGKYRKGTGTNTYYC